MFKVICLLLGMMLFLMPQNLAAQSNTTSAATSAAAPSSQKPTSIQNAAAQEDEDDKPPKNRFYERLTIENLSRTYWALSKFELTNDEAVDFYAMINECDIYKEFSANEFEWASIREATRNYIEANKKNFPLRYEIIQPLKLGEYNKQEEAFEIQDEYKIQGVRRFEVATENFYDTICGFDRSGYGRNIPGYPRSVIVELSRPIALVRIPMSPEKAEEYLEEKTKGKNLNTNAERNREQILDLREVFMSMKVKLFSYRKDVTLKGAQTQHAEVLAILERIEIYSDMNKKNLLYSEDYTRKKKSGDTANLLKQKLADKNVRTGLLAPDVPSLMPAIIETTTQPAKQQ